MAERKNSSEYQTNKNKRIQEDKLIVFLVFV